MNASVKSISSHFSTAQDTPTQSPVLTASEEPANDPVKPSIIRDKWLGHAREFGARVFPPILTLAVLIGLWELLCSDPASSLPSPSTVVTYTWELIIHPLYDNGGIDIGLFWHLLESLKRVAIGYVLAAFAGIAVGVLVRLAVHGVRQGN